MNNHTESGVPSPGLLSPWLARRRRRTANRLIPEEARVGRILDIGCGTHPIFLLNTRFAGKYGVDRFAREHEAPQGITLKHCELEQTERLPFDDSHFSVVTMLAVLEHIHPARLPALIRDIRRVLVPGGYFIFTTPSSLGDRVLAVLSRLGITSSAGYDDHKDRYTRTKLRRIFADTVPDVHIELGLFELGMNIWGRVRM
jgi:SAM-dependent methyltransferase